MIKHFLKQLDLVTEAIIELFWISLVGLKVAEKGLPIEIRNNFSTSNPYKIFEPCTKKWRHWGY